MKGRSSSNGGIVEYQKEFWQAAVTLPGSIEPADYKRYVLPLLFLRFLSIRYEHRYVLTLGRYVGGVNGEDDETPIRDAPKSGRTIE